VINSSADTCAFKIGYYDAANGGTLLYSETFTNIELGDFDGIFNLALGTGTRTAGSETNFIDVFANHSDVYLNIDFDASGSATFSTPETFTVDGTNRMQLRAAAFSMVAAKILDSNTQFIKNSNSLQASSNFNISGNGTIGGALTATSASISGDFVVDSAHSVFKVDTINNMVGIGTSSPTAKLQITGSTDNIQLLIKGNSTQTSNIQEWQNSSGIVLGAFSNLGKFGIGTAAPATLLHVNSPSSDTNILTLQDTDGTCSANPEAGSVTWACSSDSRLKSNIVNSASILDSLLQVQIRNYTINTSGNSMTGVIAQEFQQLFPDRVKIGSDGFLSVSEFSSWELLKGLQETNTKIDSVTQDSKNLNSAINNLQHSIANTDNAYANSVEFNQMLVASIYELNSKMDILNSNNYFSLDNIGDLGTTKNLALKGLTADLATINTIHTENLYAMNLDVTGLLTSAEIKTDLISLFSGKDLTIKLSDSLGASFFTLQNTDNAPLFSVSSKGDVNILGKLTVKTDSTDASVGTAIIAANTYEITIRTTAVSAKSKVFVTVNDDANYGFPIVKVSNKADGVFVVKLNTTFDHDISFDWWVIN
jgi:hypothetical protein